MGIFFLIVRLCGNHLILHPMRDGNWKMAEESQGFESCTFSTTDGLRLQGWFFRNHEANWTLMWCHGEAGNITHCFDQIKFFQRAGFSVFIFDYRGYGKSEGNPFRHGIHGLYGDTLAAYHYLVETKSVPSEKIVLFGRSLGGALAIQLAQRLRKDGISIRALVLESPWTSPKHLARATLGFSPPWPALPLKFSSDEGICDIVVPLLIIHGKKDEMIPFEEIESLYEKAPSQRKELYSVEGAGHGDAYLLEGLLYFDKIRDFVAQHGS